MKVQQFTCQRLAISYMFVYTLLFSSYIDFQSEDFTLSGWPALYVLLASFAIASPLAGIIARLWDGWRKKVSVNWFPVYFVMLICAILALFPWFFEITINSIYFVAILALITLIGFAYTENDWRMRMEGKREEDKVYTAEEISDIENLQDIEKLILRKKKLTHIDLSPLAQCHNLREIDLIFNRLQSIDLSPLAHCTNLEILRLDENKLTEIDLTPLTSLSNLKGLTIQLNKLESISLEPLSNCVNLEILFLGGNNMKQIDLSPLSQCKELKSIGIDSYSADPDLSPLENCTKLESFSIEGDEFKTIDFEPFRHCPNLNFIGIAANLIEELDLSPLESCKKLHTIEFNNEAPLSMNVTALFSIPAFSKLSGIWATTRLWAAQIPPEKDDWPKGLGKYRKRIKLG